MTHPHFVPPNSVPVPNPAGQPAQATAPGPPAFVAASDVAPEATEQGHGTDTAPPALVEATNEVPLLSTSTESTSDERSSQAPVSPLVPAAEAETLEAEGAPSTEAASVEPAEADPSPETEEAQTIIEEAQAVLEEAQADIEEAKSDLQEADADLAQAQAELDEAEEELTTVAEATEDTTSDVVVVAVYESEDDFEDYSDDDEDDEPADQLRPGDVEESIIAIWDPEVAERYRDAWRDIQAHFVDEPEAALGEAQDLVAEAVQALADALLAEQVSLDPHEQDATPDTEAMRVAMRGYRDFLERVLAL